MLVQSLRLRSHSSASLLQEDQPADFSYTHMWVSGDGETHLKECVMKGFEMKKFAETEQWVKPTESPTKVPLCQLRCENSLRQVALNSMQLRGLENLALQRDHAIIGVAPGCARVPSQSVLPQSQHAMGRACPS